MPGLALMRRSYREGSDASLLSALHHQRSTSLPPKRSAAAAERLNASLGNSDRTGTDGSRDGDANLSVNEPTWFSHAFHGSGACSCGLDSSTHHECNDTGNNPTSNDPADDDDDDDDSSMESMELASGSEFRLRPTTTAPRSSVGINGNQTIKTNNQASVSSLTLGSKLVPSSKLVPGLPKNKQNTKDCEQSVNSHSEDSTASSSKGSISKRMRGRSLGIPFSRKNKDKKNRKNGDHNKSEEGTDLSSKKAKADKKKQSDKKDLRGRSQSARDRSKQRDRSRSMVRDMKSFIDSIDSSCFGENSISMTTSTHTSPINNSTDVGVSDSGRSYGKQESAHTGTTYRSSFDSTDTPSSSLSTSISSRQLKHDNKGSFWNKFKGTDQEQQIISALHETNLKNECTIEQLRKELANLTNERNAFRTNSERLMEVMTRQKEEIQNEMHNERTGFASITNSQKREIDQWKHKANKMYKKVKMLDAQARERERILQRYDEDLGKEGMREREERLRTLERDIAHILNSNSNNDGNNDASFNESVGASSSSLPSISDMESRLSSMAAKYEAQIKHLESQNKIYQDEVSSLKEKIEEVQDEKDDEVAMVRVLENKLSGCRIIIEAMKEEDESIATSVNDDLVQKLGDLAEENGSLLSRCQRLERELEAAKSKEEVGRKLVTASKASIEETTRKVDSVQQKNEEHLSTILSLRSENKELRSSFSRDLNHSKRLIIQLFQSLEGDSSPSSSDMFENVTPHVPGEAGELLTIEEIMERKKTLRESLVDAIKLAEQMRGRMAAFAKTHEATINEYEERVAALGEELNQDKTSREKLLAALADLKEENNNLNGLVVSSVRDEIAQEQQLATEGWGREKMEMATALDTLKLENENLRASMKEMNDLVQTAEECTRRLKEENASLQKERLSYQQESKNATADRENAYETCRVLQQEINVLRQSVSDSMERTEVLISLAGDEDDSSYGYKEKLDALLKANDLLNNEVKQKNEALEGVRTVLENLKADQATVKKTIVELRQENAKLKEELKVEPSTRSTPRPPSRGRSKTPPPPRKQTSNGSDDNAKITELESRVKRVENENKGLRDANSTLSVKLFDEMEKTDALRVANDGLAARICKLVTFIQENAQGKPKLTQSNSSGSTSKKSSKNPIVTQSPHGIVLKKSSSNPVVTPMPMKKKKKTTSRQVPDKKK
ncbi:hypothetical protein ACHAWT_009549 [Skeletonema menzelii]